jgi:hypothetical protein
MCFMVCQSASKGPLRSSWFVEKTVEERHYLLVEGVYRPQKLLLTFSHHKWFRLEMYTVMNAQKLRKHRK